MRSRRRPDRRTFGRVAIVGVGLVGGSIGLALKARGLARHVAGVTLDAKTLRAALRAGAVDSGTTDLATGLAGASIVILAAGVDALPRLAEAALREAGEATLVTDVGSVKRPVVRAAGRDPRFVPGHPMAGSEKSGVGNADPSLFSGAVVVLTPARSAPWAVSRASAFWRALGARPILMSAEDHDARAAAASHAPYLAAAALADALAASAGRLAAGGFRDTTRVAASDPALWTGILLANRSEVRRSLKAFRASLDRMESALVDGDPRRLRRSLERASRERSRGARAARRTRTP